MKEKKPSETLNNISTPSHNFLKRFQSPETTAKEFLYIIEQCEIYKNDLETLTDQKKFFVNSPSVIRKRELMSQTVVDNLLPDTMSVSELKNIIPTVLEEIQIEREKFNKLIERDKELADCAKRIKILEEKYEPKVIELKDVDKKVIETEGTNEILEELQKEKQRYVELKKQYDNDEIEKKLSEVNRKIINIEFKLNSINHCISEIYTYLIVNKRDKFFDMLTTYYNSMEGKKEPHKKLIYTMLYTLQVAEKLGEKFGFNYQGPAHFNKLYYDYNQAREEYENKIGTPKKESTEKLVRILESFMDNYIKAGGTISELIEKLKPVEQYYDIQINSKGVLIKLKEDNALLTTNPVEVLNALFKKFYEETKIQSRSMKALKNALDEHGVTYEVPNDWYNYMGWSIPLITDKNSVIINYDDKAYVEYQKQQGEREHAFFDKVKQELESAQNIIKICTNEKEILRQKNMADIVTKLSTNLDEICHGTKKLFTKKIKNDLVRNVLDVSIESLKDLSSRFPQIEEQEILDVIANMKMGLKLAEQKLAPIKINDDKKIVEKIIHETLDNLKKQMDVNVVGVTTYKVNPKIKEAIESYGISTNLTESSSERVIRPEEPKINNVEERWNNCKGKMNVNLISQIMNNFVEEYCKYKGWVKGGASVEELQKKLGHLDQYFEIKAVEGKIPEIVCKPQLNTVDPKILFNDMFKKFYNESGYMGSRSTESLKKALSNKEITFVESSNWPYRAIPEVTDDNKRFKSVEPYQVVNESQPSITPNFGSPKN